MRFVLIEPPTMRRGLRQRRQRYPLPGSPLGGRPGTPSGAPISSIYTSAIPSAAFIPLLGSTGACGAEVSVGNRGKSRGRDCVAEAARDPVTALVREWRVRAGQNRTLYGDEPRAHLITHMAAELETALEELHGIELTYDEAAQLMACSYGTIKNRVANGELTNVGTRSEPRIALRQIVSGVRATASALDVSGARGRAARSLPDEPEHVSAARDRARRLFGGAR